MADRMTAGLSLAALRPLDERADEVRATIGDAAVRAAFDKAIDGVDRITLAALQEKHADAARQAKSSAPQKYLDLPRWFKHHAEIFCDLGLDSAEPLDILDIGSGGCHFLRLCKVHGHRALGLDIAWPPLYHELCALLGTERIVEGVFFGRNLASGVGRYDLITMHAQNFDWHRDEQRFWAVEEWAGYLEHLTRNHLRFPGRVSIKLNRRPTNQGERLHIPELVDLARAHSAQIGPRPERILFSLEQPLAFPELQTRW